MSVSNFDAANSEIFRVNTFVNFLFSFTAEKINKRLRRSIRFPLYSLANTTEIVWKQHTTFLNRAKEDSKRYAVTKAFFALKGRTDITWNITAITHYDESFVSHVWWIWTRDRIVPCWQCVLHVVFCHKEKHLTFVYNCVWNVSSYLVLVNLRMRLEQIAFVLKRIVPLG